MELKNVFGCMIVVLLVIGVLIQNSCSKWLCFWKLLVILKNRPLLQNVCVSENWLDFCKMVVLFAKWFLVKMIAFPQTDCLSKNFKSVLVIVVFLVNDLLFQNSCDDQTSVFLITGWISAKYLHCICAKWLYFVQWLCFCRMVVFLKNRCVSAKRFFCAKRLNVFKMLVFMKIIVF